MSTKKRSASWADCKAAMAQWPRAGVIALVQELYRLSEDNRRFLHARLLPEKSTETLQAAERLVRKMVSFASCLRDDFRHIQVKRMVDQFEKASADPAAVAALLLADIDASTQALAELGDYEEMVDHIDASLNRLDKVLEQLAPDAAAPRVQHLSTLAARWANSFGYGLSDELSAMAQRWREKLHGDRSLRW